MKHSEALLALKRYLKPLVSIPDKEFELLSSHTQLVSLEKQDVLLRAGHASKTFWFIAQGLVRNYYTTKEGKEFNKSFILAPGFCGAMSEILQDLPSRFSISALEPSTALAISIDGFRRASADSHGLQRLARLMAEQLALKKELREAELLLDDATTRYRHFVKANPQLIHRLPAYHIASYLGITEVALSRIKRNLNLG